MNESSKRRLVFIITGLLTGGAEIMLYKLVSELDREQFSCTVISLTDDGPIGDKLRQIDIPVEILGMHPGVPSPLKMLQLAKHLRYLSPHLVQTWMYHADLIGGIAAKIAGNIPVVWGIRNNTLDPLSTKRTTYLTVRACALLSGIIPHKIVSNTRSAREIHIQSGYQANKMMVIPNGFDLATFKPDIKARLSVREELGIASDTPLIGLISRYDPMKDHQNFIRAASLLNRDHPQVHYLLCGNDINWQNHDLAGWISASGLESNFHLLGSREDMPRLTASLDISTMCSYGDAFPNAIGEAMACEIPCVVTDVGDLRYIVGNTGRIIPPRNSDELANAWREILNMSPSQRDVSGKAARKRVEQLFSLPVIISMYTTLYQQIIQNKFHREIQ